MSAKPAEPILASIIYSQLYPENAADNYDSADAQRKRKRRRVVGTGCKTLDETLRGGLVYGAGGLCCVSGEQNAGVGEVSLLSFSFCGVSFFHVRLFVCGRKVIRGRAVFEEEVKNHMGPYAT